jgi:hypothetical protein
MAKPTARDAAPTIHVRGTHHLYSAGITGEEGLIRATNHPLVPETSLPFQTGEKPPDNVTDFASDAPYTFTRWTDDPAH